MSGVLPLQHPVVTKSGLKVGDRVTMRGPRRPIWGSGYRYIIAFRGVGAWLGESPDTRVEDCRSMVHVEDLRVTK